MDLHDVLALANDRANAYMDLWKYYVLIVGAAFTIAKLRPSTQVQQRLFPFALPFAFVACALPNLYALWVDGNERNALLDLAGKIAWNGPPLTAVLASLRPSPWSWVAAVHLSIDIVVATFLYLAAKSTESIGSTSGKED